jgi:MFS family permease
MVVGMALAFLVWAMSASFWPLAAFAFAFGLFYGGWVALVPAVVADYFGARNLGTLIGASYPCALPSALSSARAPPALRSI